MFYFVVLVVILGVPELVVGGNRFAVVFLCPQAILLFSSRGVERAGIRTFVKGIPSVKGAGSLGAGGGGHTRCSARRALTDAYLPVQLVHRVSEPP